ncbi:hypothetical protein MMC11_009019 [Xylographa trunciseda]|nr:hypothetical protein [Xylographa trunciseda]
MTLRANFGNGGPISNYLGKIMVAFQGNPSLLHNDPGETRGSGDSQSQDNVWIKHMESFINWTKDVELDGVLQESVKVALIDNEVDSEYSAIANIKDGVSYGGQDSKHTPFRDYYTEPSIHGTRMALCIRNICPKADLYMARMDNSDPLVKVLTIKSATQLAISDDHSRKYGNN